MRYLNSAKSLRPLLLAALLSLLAGTTGCRTLASLGLPVGGAQHKILDPAKEISQAPTRSIQAPTESTKAPLDNFVIEVGDTVLIETTNFDATVQLPGDQIVKPDGYISLGECGRLMVMNKTIEQIQAEAQLLVDDHVRQKLEVAFEVKRRQRQDQRERERLKNAKLESEAEADDQLDDDLADLDLDAEVDQEQLLALQRSISEAILTNKISARIVNWDSKRIYVLGEVNSPGSFVYLGSETVLDAILEAGGLAANANQHQIVVSRPSNCNDCRTVMQVCYDQLVQLGDTSTNYQLRPGDRVFVPTLTFTEDLKRSLKLNKNDRCPRCAKCPKGCDLPQGCSTSAQALHSTTSSFGESVDLIEVVETIEMLEAPVTPPFTPQK